MATALVQPETFGEDLGIWGSKNPTALDKTFFLQLLLLLLSILINSMMIFIFIIIIIVIIIIIYDIILVKLYH